ncbi:methylated-DNA--[protein]-cysteine S-methyltransferase [Streptomyces sp. NRRL S-1813]|uniref:methylated-DNA--[protein]-cysteine S-methyltransferase n=1 Tax=Streptomyces sp. NRRL S-1813 TaxID=1463888 RepID=UPI0004CBCE46|nr:methylated-DNA--[protein]-cysteine S-methyltransferase [Streptomyces sp. NRRL S-1813]
MTSTAATTATPTLSYTTLDSPLGELLLVGEESPTAPGGTALISLSLPQQRGAATVQPHWRRDARPFAEVLRRLRSYFAGELTRFALEFRTTGTEFQEPRLSVYRAATYGLGAAIGANPLPILRPCHRVIGADGTMRGYAAGVERKTALLTHEGALQPTLI